jgi:membrane protein DedA with SNARE-associated domain
MAGSSELTYLRFLAYELPGALGYAVGYVAIGYLAGESWEQVSKAVGTGWAAVFAVVGLVIWITTWWRRRR